MKKILTALISLFALYAFVCSGLITLSPRTAHTATSIGGGFTLISQDGKRVSDTDLRGKYLLVFFGFTHCPDICPTTLWVISQALDQLKEDGGKVAPLFITLDPERDTPEVLKSFLSNFSPTIIGLTGSTAQINKIQADYKTYALKVKDKNAPGGYGFDHSAYIYLMDPQGNFMNVFTDNSNPNVLAEKIKEQLKKK